MTTATPTKPKLPGKQVEPMTPEEQRKAFEDTGRELECDESEERFEAALRAIGKQRVPMMRARKTAEELKELLNGTVRSLGHPLEGAQWIKIVAVEPATEVEPNWRVAHSGEEGGFANALDEAEKLLQQKYTLIQS